MGRPMRPRVGVAIVAVLVVLLLLVPPRASPSSNPAAGAGLRLADGGTPPGPPAPPPPLGFGGGGGNWPAYLGDPERTGSNLEERTLAPNNVSRLGLEWGFTTKNGSIYSSPVVINGTVYVGSGNGYEYAVDAATGQLVWKAYLGTDRGCSYGSPNWGTISSPALWNGTLYWGEAAAAGTL